MYSLLVVVVLIVAAEDTSVSAYECMDHYFKCPGDYCIPYHYVCDGQWQCPDGEDESNCGMVFLIMFRLS